jgi:hypothetical protein
MAFACRTGGCRHNADGHVIIGLHHHTAGARDLFDEAAPGSITSA